MPAAGSAVYLCADAHNRAEDVQSACSVAVSYKPPMLVTRARLPACAAKPACGSCVSVSSQHDMYNHAHIDSARTVPLRRAHTVHAHLRSVWSRPYMRT